VPGEHRTSVPLRVRFSETDAMGVANNAAYLAWFEVGRVEYLRAYAGGYQALRDLGIEAFVLESYCRYIVPARFDDLLRVYARCINLRGARFRYEYAIVRDDGTQMAEGWTAHACVDARTFKPTRMPGRLVDAIASAESSPAPAESSPASSAP
jgi:acyl-CoA thioester hydrolase